MSARLRVVGPDERAPRLVRRLLDAAIPARRALAYFLLRVAHRVATESLDVVAYASDTGDVMARLVGVGHSRAEIRNTIVGTAQRLIGPTPEPAA